MKRATSHITLSALIGWLLLIIFPWSGLAIQQAEDDDVLNRRIQLTHSKGTIYKLLGQISKRSGYLFIYDSKIINNEEIVKIKAGEYTIGDAIQAVINNPDIQVKAIGNHILLHTESPTLNVSIVPDTISTPIEPTEHIIEGTLSDLYSQEAIPFGTIGIKGTSIGTISNQNGEFRILIPDSLRQNPIQFSHLGYQPQEIEYTTLEGKHPIITLEPKVISIQEVVIRRINPYRLVQEMLDHIAENYSQKPVYHTTFYREGIEWKKGFVSLTEAVFKTYKGSYTPYSSTDQVKMLKMRRISNNQEKDTLVTKIKSGIEACLILDIIKNLPDFLDSDRENYYTYAHSDIAVIDNRMVNVISFTPKSNIHEPLLQGELYIDTDNNALVRASFEINPQYVKKSSNMLIVKKSKDLKITPQKVSYTISYKPWNGTYYINHVRGDLRFKIKKRKQLFNTASLHTWFEMATCKTDTSEVNRFTRKEILPTRTIFSETRYSNDASFWNNFNVILPEEKLSEAIAKISAKIEETGY